MKVRNSVYENMNDESTNDAERAAAQWRAETIGKAAEQIQQEFDDGFHGRVSPKQHANGWASGDGGVYEIAMSAEERLQSAAEVVEDLQRRLRLADVVIQTLKDTIAERDALLLDFQRFMRHHAKRLALAGSYDHKGKNEVMMSIIAALLSVSEDAINVTRSDDVPF